MKSHDDQPDREARSGPFAQVASTLEARLRGRLAGDVRFDRLSRTIYATDASIYEIPPIGVVMPRNVRDVVATLETCGELGVPMIARGAGTGLTGAAVGMGVIVDFSKYMNKVGPVDVDGRTVEVEPGVVLDELNARIGSSGLHFAPDVATSSRATIGGMIANNSCGAHSIVYGRTVDHVDELLTVLSDGSVVRFSDAEPAPRTGVAGPPGASKDDGDPVRSRPDQRLDPANPNSEIRVAELEEGLERIRDDYQVEIARRFPRILRSNGGYGLDRLGNPGVRARAIRVLCGSEGTLALVTRAKLRLVPIPKSRGLVVLSFIQLDKALELTSRLLEHQPSAIELMDRLILEGGRRNPALRDRCGFLSGAPAAILVVEFSGDDPTQVADRLQQLMNDPDVDSAVTHKVPIMDPAGQADVWAVRKSGLGLLMSQPGSLQPNAFVEDTAVDPSRLREYVDRFTTILDQEGVRASYYAHASVGCLHVRPVLALREPADGERVQRIAERVTDLVVEFGGTITGEHGDGIIRSCWLERLYGPQIMQAFREVKSLFDPAGILNPHKIVDPWPMTEHLRRYGSAISLDGRSHLEFGRYDGIAGMAGMCSGVGQCRQRLVGTMCPSYMATGDERHTTRARAVALRVALSGDGLMDGLDDPAIDEVLDLCLSCKACRTECPTGVDMARIKSEVLSSRVLRDGADRRTRLIADTRRWASRASYLPRLANLVAQSRFVRSFVERRFGLDHRMPPPRLASRTFFRWYRSRPPRCPSPSVTKRGPVVLFIDTWTNYFVPQVGRAAVTLLENLGFDVHCPRLSCCGRPAISKGLLAEARQSAISNIEALSQLAGPEVPIVGLEPSCILTMRDEYPQLVHSLTASRIAAQTTMIESFLRKHVDLYPVAIQDQVTPAAPLLYHGHCHQKALVGTSDAVAVLRGAFGNRVTEINSGCCGMAGSFGHEKEHYEVARAIGEDRLFPAIRSCPGASVVVSGFSCRHQIAHHTGVQPRHVVEYVSDAMAEPCRGND